MSRRARKGRLAMLEVSLDASAAHQLANTPTQASFQQPADASAQAGGAGHTRDSDDSSVDASHGGHMGKLHASLTKSAVFQLPPTPTPANMHVPRHAPSNKPPSGARPSTMAQERREHKPSHGVCVCVYVCGTHV